jgi:O-antigen ligase
MLPADAPSRHASDTIAARVLQAGALAVVLVATPYKTFDLDRFFVPKELALVVVAMVVGAMCLMRARRISLTRIDQLLLLAVGLSVLSALFATNWWLAARALAITLAGFTCFWTSRSLANAGYSRALVGALALAGVIGAVTSLLQAYGVRTELFSLNRAPGGTFGNRNFMAHLATITLPALFYSAIRAESKAAVLRWCAGIAIIGAALVLSRTRAAWLALAFGFTILLIATAIAMWKHNRTLKLKRALLLLLAAIAGGALALVIPNTLDWRSDSPYLETAQGLVNYKGGSGHGRLIQYQNSLRMTVRHPILGVGPGNWAVVYPRFASDDDPSLSSEGMTANPWPSSDWVAFLSERGFLAMAALLVAMLIMAVDGLRALRARPTTDERLGAAIFLATLAIVAMVGAFDAVTMLAAPALIGWSLLGALSPPSRERATFELGGKRIAIAALVAAVFALSAVRSGFQLAAMGVYSNNSKIAMLERASSMDPGNYRMHVRLAEGYINRGSCTKARPHASAARALFPSSPTAKRLSNSCSR